MSDDKNGEDKKNDSWEFICIVILFYLVGKFHLIVGGNLSQPIIVKKDTFGFSETIIDINKITGIPMLFAKAQYPLGFRILEREKLIMPSPEIEERNKQTNKFLEDVENERQRLLRDLEKIKGH